MRILHVTHELPPYEFAGTGIYAYHVARAQARHHDVFMFARRQDLDAPAGRLTTEARDGLVIRFTNQPKLPWSPLSRSYEDPVTAHHFESFLDEVQPQVVHFHHVMGLGVLLFDVVRRRGLPTVMTLHDFWTMCPMGQRMCHTDQTLCDPIDFSKCGPCVYGADWSALRPKESVTGASRGQERAVRGWRAQYERRVAETPGRRWRRPRAVVKATLRTIEAWLKSPERETLPFTANPFEHRFNVFREKLLGIDLLIAPSAFLRDQFLEHFRLEPEKVLWSAYGMDLAHVRALQKTAHAGLRVGYVGSIIKTKGVHVLIEAFLEASKAHPTLELHIHGGPAGDDVGYADACRRLAVDHPAASRIRWHGRFEHQAIGEVLSRIDLLVVPSIWFENAPLILHEAAITGTPVLTSNRGGMREFVEVHRYGRTFELGNPRALAAELCAMAADPIALRALAGGAPPVKSIVRNAEELIGLYRAIMEERYSPPSIEEQSRSRGGILA